jgi:cysteinyl-tRNA synthetase
MKKYSLILFLIFISNFSSAQIDVGSWAYQLQDINITEISNNSTFELVVIDYSNDGSDENKFTKNDIQQIKNSGKIAIAYISIGEAETYRNYWKEEWDADNNGVPDNSAPSWLGNENPDWKGNYEVRYWDERWQSIIYNYIDTIIAQDFDGIYCDIVDGYYYWREVVREKNDADTLMIQFLSNIREHVDSKTSGRFYIIPQNGEFIINEENVTEVLKQKYFKSIDAIGIEDVFFFGELDEDNPFNPDAERLSVLSEFLQNSKPVFSIEYLTNTNLINEYKTKANENGFIPYVSTRPLNILNDGIVLTDVTVKTKSTNFVLNQNYPNPFNPSTVIEYSIPTNNSSNTMVQNVQLIVYDILGNKVATLVNSKQLPGNYAVAFNSNHTKRYFASGLYIYKLATDNYSTSKKMLLIK